ncbi:MAG: DUF5658 family protein [Planctomycetota bacterium]|nr:DUF5658 family protein [Planctomycetota bacterium]
MSVKLSPRALSHRISTGAARRLLPAGLRVTSPARPGAAVTLLRPTRASRFLGPRALRRRMHRVSLLLVVTVACGVLDLGLTLGFMYSGGMYEDNPLVHWLLASTGSGLSVVALRLGTLAIAVGVLYALRRQRRAEIGAWIVALALACVVVRWVAYLDEARERQDAIHAAIASNELGFARVR